MRVGDRPNARALQTGLLRSSRRSVLLALLLLTSSAQAFELGPSDSPVAVEVHGFASQGFILSTGNNYLANNSERGSFEFTEVGINFSKTLVDRLRIGLQLFARDLGPVGNYNARFDWFHLDYRFRDWLGIRAGRVKLPFGLYNDTSDIDAARVPILLPQSVYPIANRDFLLAQTGAELYGYVSLGAAGALDYRAYAGTIFMELPRRGSSPVEVDAVDVPYLTGARILWETPLTGLRLGGTVQALRLDFHSSLAGRPLEIQLAAMMWVVSAEYAWRDLLIAAEYSRWQIRVYSDDQSRFPNDRTNSERGYLMASYRFARWFQPGLYYSVTVPSGLVSTGASSYRHDLAATLRFDINSFWSVKLEGHFLRGTAELNSAMNGNIALDDLPSRWALFLVKTTASF